MAAKKGRLFLIKVGDGGSPQTFTTIGGIQTKSLTINNEGVDITDDDGAPWRKMLSDAGLRSVSISGSGIHKGEAAGIEKVENLAMGAEGNTIEEFQAIDSVTGDYFQGSFEVASYERSGEATGAQNFSITLESADTASLTRA